MLITALVAGTNEPSNAHVLAMHFLQGAQEAGCATEVLRLRDMRLPQFTVREYEPDCGLHPDFLKIKDAILRSDGMVIATPIWNFSVPAHLKNIIDWMGCFALDHETKAKGQLQSKPFFFIFTGGAPVAAWKGLMRFTTMHVSESIRYFDGTVVGKYFEGKCNPGKGIFGLVVDKRPDSLKRVEQKGKEFGALVRRFMETGTLPLRYRLILNLYKFGQLVMAKL